MSDDIVIRAEHVSKRYRISHLAGQGTLRDTLHHAARLAWRRVRWNTKLNREDFWALNDINFEIKRGEVVGIIGRNGAGKSTLLKILSRITEPTSGRITLRGRVASLLEVGTGFHPELTGRDNIFLNGAILGMSRVEIRKKFDEIVAFAEVERFLDTPVKRYSSGMYVRLAFAVAAHLEPEILIVDEVLAVGDAAFQRKCLGKMREVAASGGRTVIFVSHNVAAVQNLCSRVISLKSGMIAAQGPTDEMLRLYGEENALSGQKAEIDLSSGVQRNGEGGALFTKLRVTDANRHPTTHFSVGEPFYLQLTFNAAKPLSDFVLGFSINSTDGQVIVCSNHYDSLQTGTITEGPHTLEVLIDDVWLSPGMYTFNVAVSREDNQTCLDFIRDAGSFVIEPRAHVPAAIPSRLVDARPGFIRRPLAWRQVSASSAL